MRLSCKGWLVLSVIYGDGNCSRRATVRLGIDTLIANILVFYADIADTLQLRDVAMATTFWLSMGYNFS